MKFGARPKVRTAAFAQRSVACARATPPGERPERSEESPVIRSHAGSAAEEFAKGDPLVVHGVVASWFIREWNEALAGP